VPRLTLRLPVIQLRVLAL
ncbi:hypothetical protein Gorai_006338, partial [Gossypium raimondii]|nr:hypothetical protein [Gossypium raimondii]